VKIEARPPHRAAIQASKDLDLWFTLVSAPFFERACENTKNLMGKTWGKKHGKTQQ
jgi:hypothetical protein